MINTRSDTAYSESLFSIKNLEAVLVLLFALYYFFVFLGLFSPRFFELFLLLASFCFFATYGKVYFNTFPVLLSFLYIFFSLLSWFFMSVDYQQINSEFIGFRSLLGFILFVPLAFLIKGSASRIVILFVSSALGFLLSPIFYDGGLEDIVSGLYGSRVWLAGRNPIMTGVNAAVFLMLTMLLIAIFFRSKKYFSLFLSVGAFLILIIYLYVSHSRTAYVGLFAVVALLSSYLVWLSIFSNRGNAIVKMIYLLFFLAVIAYSAVTSGMLEKTYREKETLKAVFTMDFDSAPDTSWGYRVQMIDIGFDYMLQRPLKGWGSNGGEIALKKSGFNDEKRQRFSHLHNDYLEYGVSYGFLFFVIYVAFFIWLLFSLFKVTVGLEKNKNIGVFVFLSLFFFFVVSNFDVVQTHSATSRLFILTFAAALSIVWFGLSEPSEKNKAALWKAIKYQ